MFRLPALILLLLLLPATARANPVPPYILEYVPFAQETGSGRLTYLTFDVYKATLYAPRGKWSGSGPLALRLAYLMSLKGEKIAERSAQEISRQGYMDRKNLMLWQSEMTAIFPDVRKGSVLTGILDAKGNTVFFDSDRKIGEIRDKEFGIRFFDIWLSAGSSDPGLTAQLTGRKT